jgi:hypothetical protein
VGREKKKGGQGTDDYIKERFTFDVEGDVFYNNGSRNDFVVRIEGARGTGAYGSINVT